MFLKTSQLYKWIVVYFHFRYYLTVIKQKTLNTIITIKNYKTISLNN